MIKSVKQFHKARRELTKWKVLRKRVGDMIRSFEIAEPDELLSLIDRQIVMLAKDGEIFETNIKAISDCAKAGCARIDQESPPVPTVDQAETIHHAVRKENHQQTNSMQAEILQRIPQTLIEKRLALGWTQTELATHIGLRPQNIHRYEKRMYSGISLERATKLLVLLEKELLTAHETVKSARNAQVPRSTDCLSCGT